MATIHSFLSALRHHETSAEHKHLGKFQERVVRQLNEKLKSYNYGLSKRRCPSCDRLNVRLVLDGIALDFCKRCRGIWFDSAELVHFTDLIEDVPGADLANRPSRFRCPVCNEQMQEYQFRRLANVLVDACTNGHGVFLESGEFERVLEVAES